MPAIFVKGDLFADRELDALAHGCNCAGAMGKGIALQFRSRFPKMYEAYKNLCADGRFRLGDVFTWHDDHITVFNLGTQKTWRTKADPNAVETATRSMIHQAERMSIRKIGLPRIAAGLGGLAWTDVRSMLSRLGDETKVTLVVFEEYEPGMKVQKARDSAGH